MARIALEDFGDGGRPGLHALGGDADLTPDEHVGQGRGVAGELCSPASIGERLGLEARERLGVDGARIQAEQSAVAVARQMGAKLACEPFSEIRVGLGVCEETGADEDLAAGEIAAGLSAQARLGEAYLVVDGVKLLSLGGLELVLGGPLGNWPSALRAENTRCACGATIAA